MVNSKQEVVQKITFAKRNLEHEGQIKADKLQEWALLTIAETLVQTNGLLALMVENTKRHT